MKITKGAVLAGLAKGAVLAGLSAALVLVLSGRVAAQGEISLSVRIATRLTVLARTSGARHPDALGAAGSWARAMGFVGAAHPESRYNGLRRSAAPLFVDAGCRDAVLSSSVVEIGRACSEAYCPECASEATSTAGFGRIVRMALERDFGLARDDSDAYWVAASLLPLVGQNVEPSSRRSLTLTGTSARPVGRFARTSWRLDRRDEAAALLSAIRRARPGQAPVVVIPELFGEPQITLLAELLAHGPSFSLRTYP